MAQDLNRISEIVKTYYLPAFENQLNVEPSPFLEKITKTALLSNTIKSGAPIGINGGFGFGAEGKPTPAAGGQNYKGFELDAADMYVDIHISNKVVRLASGSEGALIDALDSEIKSSYAAAKWNVARALFGDSRGILTNVSAAQNATNVVTVADTSRLIEGLTVDFYATNAAVGSTPAVAARRILAVDRAAKTITIDGTATTIAAGFITVQNSYGREIAGLGSIINDSVDTIYGIRKADNSWIKPVVVDCDNDISDIILYKGIKEAEDFKNSKVDMVLMGDDAFTAYQEYMRTNNVVNVEKMTFEGGSAGYNVIVGSRVITVVNERFVGAKEAIGVDTTAFKLYQTGWDFMAKDGAIFVPMAGTSVYRALLANYGNLMCENPGGVVHYQNIVA